MQENETEDFFANRRRLLKLLGILVLLLTGILFYTKDRPIDFMANPYLAYPLVLSLIVAALLFFSSTLILRIQAWRKRPHSARLGRMRFYAVMLLGLSALAFFLLRSAALIQLHYTPEQTMHARIVGFFPAGRGGCAKWVLLLGNQARVKVCRTGPAFDINTNRVLKVSVKQAAWTYEVRYLEHSATLPEQP
ncbi:hypothetical protein [Neisseria sp. CCUG12390]|uniref:hypothetical protein n=1 Tax=Neisseria sp. CCUG12390 TaxID=3392035 RepID=UPI003A0FC341